jgi:hypothetical protein
MKIEELDSRDNIGLVLDEMGLNGTGVEVGVAFGDNAEQILIRSSLKKLILVDPWNYVPDQSPVGHGDMIKDWGECYKQCVHRLEKFSDRIDIRRDESVAVSRLVDDGSLDFVYIDANHMSPFIDNDISAWYPKVKSGGIFGGHDYHDYENEIFICNVKTAVDKFIEMFSLRLFVVPGQVPSWYVVKP